MSTAHPGMICIHLDGTHMTALYQIAEATNTPIQTCAAQLLRNTLNDYNAHLHITARTTTALHNITQIEQRIAARLAQLEIN